MNIFAAGISNGGSNDGDHLPFAQELHELLVAFMDHGYGWDPKFTLLGISNALLERKR